jgi:putative transposase
MPRMPRVVVPGLPHHITQRGNRRQKTFFCKSDYGLYKRLMKEWCSKLEVEIWAYCLMPNHVHLIMKPNESTFLARAVGEAHRRYTLALNRRMGWRGYLWQGRFASFPMDGSHLQSATRYILLNPVRAGLVSRAEEWPHSSARAHLDGVEDDLANLEHLNRRIRDWNELLIGEQDEEVEKRLRAHQRTGRPLGSEEFILELEGVFGRRLRPGKPGRPKHQLEP